MRTGARTMSLAHFLAAMVGATALMIAVVRAAAEPNKLPTGLLGDWCRIGGSGVRIGPAGKIYPAYWTYRRNRCSNPHYRLTVRSNGMTDGGQPCRVVDIFEERKTLLARFECGCKDNASCTARYWLSLTSEGRLYKLATPTRP
jgi:hypothetical protein